MIPLLTRLEASYYIHENPLYHVTSVGQYHHKMMVCSYDILTDPYNEGGGSSSDRMVPTGAGSSARHVSTWPCLGYLI